MQPVNDTGPGFEYALEALPPGRFGFRRWRWELWQSTSLVACGWRTTPSDAERALRTAASRRVHELLGVRPLWPERARPLDPFLPGAAVRLDCGPVECLLVPRPADERVARAA